MYHQLKYLQPRFQASLRKGAAQPHVYAKDLAKLIVAHPPLDEQRRIAAILDKADEVRSKRKAALETLETLSQAIFIDMFGDPVTNPRQFESGSLRELCEMYQPKTISGKDLVAAGQYPVYGANGQIGFYDQFNHQGSVVTVTCRGATCGTVNVIPGPSWITGNAMVVNPLDDRLQPTYLAEALRILDYSEVITGAAQPQITRATLQRARILAPPIREQLKFELQLSAVRDLQGKFKSDATSADNLFSSLQQKAFQGAL
jgi:restriction endonuclease S subunit